MTSALPTELSSNYQAIFVTVTQVSTVKLKAYYFHQRHHCISTTSRSLVHEAVQSLLSPPNLQPAAKFSITEAVRHVEILHSYWKEANKQVLDELDKSCKPADQHRTIWH